MYKRQDFAPVDVGEHITDTHTNVLYDLTPIGFTDHSEQQVKQTYNGIAEKLTEVSEQRLPTVSYTHLDVYKRQNTLYNLVVIGNSSTPTDISNHLGSGFTSYE